MKIQKEINIVLLICCASILAFLNSCQNEQAESETVNEIVGKWEYIKTVRPDGTEEFEMRGIEHYYSDGSMFYLLMFINPFSMDSIPETRNALIAAHTITDGGFGAYKTNPESKLLTITLDVCTDTAYIGKPFEAKYEISGDTIVFRDKYYFVRVRE